MVAVSFWPSPKDKSGQRVKTPNFCRICETLINRGKATWKYNRKNAIIESAIGVAVVLARLLSRRKQD